MNLQHAIITDFIYPKHNSVLSLEILVASDFDEVAGTAIYYLQYYYM